MYNFDFKKSLGQNFLKDDNVVNNIVNAVNFKENNLVIEIGPGSGMLSGRLLEKVDFAILYEIDTRLEKILDKELEMYDNYEIIFDDFLKRNVKNDLKKYNYNNLYMVANLPYYVTTPIISKIIDDDIPMNEIVIMIQKEVADRLTADVGTKEYGQITVFLNYFFNIEKMFNVSKNCFVPKPRVDSAVIKMTRKNTREKLKDISFFKKLVRDSFRFKRKTIKNNLVGYDLDKINIILQKHGLDVNVRSECISYEIFVEIANELL